MTKVFAPDTPFIVRFAAAAAAFFLAAWAWFPTVHHAPGAVNYPTISLAIAFLMAGTFTFGVLQTDRHPLLPFRATLGLAIAGSLLGMLSMPLAATAVSSMIVFGLVVILAIATNLLVEPKPRIAYSLSALIALIGVYLQYAVVVWTTSATYGAQAKVTAWPVSIIGAACIMSAWHGRRLLRRPAPSL